MSPYVSTAQQRFFHSRGAAKAGLTPKVVKEWDEATLEAPGGFKGLPDKVSQKRESKRRAAARALKGKF
jgi:hypothetical protein